jgi:hypothetical protein
MRETFEEGQGPPRAVELLLLLMMTGVQWAEQQRFCSQPNAGNFRHSIQTDMTDNAPPFLRKREYEHFIHLVPMFSWVELYPILHTFS